MEYSMYVVLLIFLLYPLQSDSAPCGSSEQWSFDRYYNNSQIRDFLNYLNATCDYHTEVHEIGKSYENRTLRVIQIGQNVNTKSIWIDGGIHSNEWIGHATAMYIACQLCDSTNPSTTELTSRWNWFILPVLNPDGYEYTWTTNRRWRKTRKPNPDSNCTGIDPNRNFNFQWGVSGFVNDPCAVTYQGANANTEPEVSSVSNFVLERKGSWDAYLNLHAPWMCWIAPYGYTENLPQDWDKMERAGKAATLAATNRHGTNYTLTRTKANSGTAKDWAYGEAGITYSYTVELRASDTSSDPFVLPPEQILPTGEETLDAILALTREIYAIEYSSSTIGIMGSITAYSLCFLTVEYIL